MIKYLENEDLEKEIATGTYIVDFYAEWCGPCKMLSKVLEEINNASIIKVNTDTHQDLAIKYGIMSIPTVIFFKDGIEYRKEVGFKTKDEIMRILNEIK